MDCFIPALKRTDPCSRPTITMVKDIRLAVLQGSISPLPILPSNIVRIFVSSTFGDTVAERNFLLEKAYPELQKWCQEKGLDFQVVDMRWGVRDEVNNDHMTTNICLREIENCQNLSIGPNVLFLLGQRYGWRPNPAVIDAVEFEILLKFAKDDNNAYSLFTDWYHHDGNSEPPVYALQPITEDNRKEWIQKAEWLSRALRKMVKSAIAAGEISEDRHHQYSMSVTEMEVEFALNVDKPDNHCVAFMRTLAHLDENLGHPKARNYTDLMDINGSEIDEESRHLLTRFKNEVVPSKLSEKNIHNYCIDWYCDGVSMAVEEHCKYLITFCTTFVKDVKTLVKRGLSESSLLELRQDTLFMEVMHHSQFCLEKCRNFCGRKDILQHIDTYLSNPDKRKPLVIHGPSGAGKTSVMAMVAQEHQKKRDCQIVIRFLGTSSQTSTIFQVMVTVFNQICEVYSLTLPKEVNMKRFADLVKHFPTLLRQVSSVAAERPLIIILDSLDQLQSAHDAYQLKWLPKTCPPNVNIVLSTLPNTFNILDELKKGLAGDECFLAVQVLPEDTGEQILKSWMAGVKRKVTVEQANIIRTAFQQCPQPIFLKLIFEEARRWKSYTAVSQNDLSHTVRDAIWQLFDRLERQFGQKVVSHALGYISASRNGVTEGELEDLLSIDDEVLDEIYQYWSPPNPNVVRLPPLLWARLHNEIQEYMVNREADGRTVMALYHRQFIEAARDKYLQDSNERKTRHQTMVEFFLGTWSGGQKKTLVLNQCKETLNADRKVSPQPIMFNKVFNYRKLNELPYQLVHAENEEQLIQYAVGNFDFLFAWVEAYTPQHVIEELEMIMDHPATSKELIVELALVQDLLRLAKPTLEYAIILNQSNFLATEMLGRMLHFADTHTLCIKSLLEGATRWCENLDVQMMYAKRSCYPAPGGPHRATLIGHTGNIRDIAANNEGTLAVSACDDCTVRLWDLTDGEPILTFKGHTGAVHSVAISSNSTRVVSGSVDNSLRIWDTHSGEEIHKIDEDHSSYTKRAILGITHDASKIISASNEHIMIYELSTGQELYQLTGHTLAISCICMRSDDEILVSGSDDKTLKVWSISTGNLLADKQEFKGGISKVAMTNEGTILAGDRAGGLKVYSSIQTEDGLQITCKHTIQTPSNAQVYSLCASNNGRWMVVAADMLVLLYSIDDGSLKHTMTGHVDVIDCVAITDTDKYIVSGARDNIMIVWDLDSGQFIENLEGQQCEVSNLVLTGDMVISTSIVSPYIKLWSTEEKYISHYNLFFQDRSGIMAVTRDKRLLLYCIEIPPTVVVWSCDSRQPVFTQKMHRSRITSVATCHDNNTALSGDESGVVLVWNIHTAQMVMIHQFEDGIREISVRCDDHYVTIAHEKYISLWDIQKQKVVTKQTPKLDECELIERVCLTSDNHTICGTGTGAVFVFGKELTKYKTLSGCKSKVTCLTLNVEENILAVGSHDCCVPIWDWRSGTLLKVIEETFSMVSMAFTTDSRYLVTGSNDKVLRLWQMSDGSYYLSHYIYSDMVTMVISENEIIGGTRYGQPIVLAIHEKPVEIMDASPSHSSVDDSDQSHRSNALRDRPSTDKPSTDQPSTDKPSTLENSSIDLFNSCNSNQPLEKPNEVADRKRTKKKSRRSSHVCHIL